MPEKKRVGLIVPAGNTTCEPDFYTSLPRHVTVHSTRISVPRTVESEHLIDQFNAQVDQAAHQLTRAKVDVIAYGHTTGSFYKGVDYSHQLVRRIEAVADVPAVTPSTALVNALQSLRAKKIFVVTPYPQWNNLMLLDYLKETDLEVVGLVGDDRAPKEAIKKPMWNQDPEDIIDFISALHIPPADALVCPCTAWRTLEIVEELEAISGLPVVTSNQAVIWETSLLLRESLVGKPLGRLFDRT